MVDSEGESEDLKWQVAVVLRGSKGAALLWSSQRLGEDRRGEVDVGE